MYRPSKGQKREVVLQARGVSTSWNAHLVNNSFCLVTTSAFKASCSILNKNPLTMHLVACSQLKIKVLADPFRQLVKGTHVLCSSDWITHPFMGVSRSMTKACLPRTHLGLSWCQILEQLKIFTVTFKYWHSQCYYQYFSFPFNSLIPIHSAQIKPEATPNCLWIAFLIDNPETSVC